MIGFQTRETSLRVEGGTLPFANVLGARINALGWSEAINVIADWARKRESRFVCISNVHMVVAACEDSELAEAMRRSDMATPDGAPVAWMLRRQGFANQPRISGTELMRSYLSHAVACDEGIFLLGSTEDTLARLQVALLNEFPGLKIAGAFSPPFRPLTVEEDAVIVARINASGAGTVWVSLGCPKQEKWMLEHRGRVNAVMVGVGAAFDFVAGTVPRAPLWMQAIGFEWLHRLASEPRRLWRRYLVTNAFFVIGALRQLLAKWVGARCLPTLRVRHLEHGVTVDSSRVLLRGFALAPSLLRDSAPARIDRSARRRAGTGVLLVSDAVAVAIGERGVTGIDRASTQWSN